jgi:hypothetical protein
MKRIMLLTFAMLALIGGAAGTAQAGSWIPGTPTMVGEDEVQDLIEEHFDWAYCSGIPRFGHKGEFPYETFVVFDCDIKLDSSYCSDARIKAVKGTKRGYFKIRWIRDGDCIY